MVIFWAGISSYWEQALKSPPFPLAEPQTKDRVPGAGMSIEHESEIEHFGSIFGGVATHSTI